MANSPARSGATKELTGIALGAVSGTETLSLEIPSLRSEPIICISMHSVAISTTSAPTKMTLATEDKSSGMGDSKFSLLTGDDILYSILKEIYLIIS